MNRADFWKTIEASRNEFDPNLRDRNQARQAELLKEALRELPPQELADYESLFSKHFFMLYTWPHWAAVYLIEGGCSDDGFDYFSAWMISMGEDAFNSVVESADNLADYAYLAGVEVIAFPNIEKPIGGYINRSKNYWLYQKIATASNFWLEFRQTNLFNPHRSER